MTNAQWDRLATAVKARVEDLEITQQEIQFRGGPSPAKVREVMNGRATTMSASKRRDLERVLWWAKGSVDDILAGGDPTPVAPSSDNPVVGIGTSKPGRPLGRAVMFVDLSAVPGDALIQEVQRRMRPDIEHMRTNPDRQWTGLVEPGDEVHDMEAASESSASAEAVEGQEVLDGPQSFSAWDTDTGEGSP